MIKEIYSSRAQHQEPSLHWIVGCSGSMIVSNPSIPESNPVLATENLLNEVVEYTHQRMFYFLKD